MDELLNKQYSLLGNSTLSHDIRVPVKQITQSRVSHATDVFCYRILKFIGSYGAPLDGAAAIASEAALGKTTPRVREQVSEGSVGPDRIWMSPPMPT